MPITLPSFVAPNEVIESAWGNAVVDALSELDDEKLDLAGGTVTGTLQINTTAATTGLSVKNLSDIPSIRLRSQANDEYAAFVGTSTELTINTLNDNPVVVTAGLDVSGDIDMDGYLLTARAGVFARNDSANGIILADYDSGTSGTAAHAFMSFYPDATSSSSFGSRGAYVGFNGAGMEVQADIGDATLQSVTGDIALEAASEIKALADAFYVGKSAPDADAVGVEMFSNTAGTSTLRGTIRDTIGVTGGTNLYLRHVSTADANSELYVNFTRATGTAIGSITQNGTTAVAYNTSSDPRAKQVDGPAVAASDIVQQLGGLAFVGRWLDDDGNPRGLSRVFVSSHDVEDLAPWMVTGERDAVDDDGHPVYQLVDFPSAVPLLLAALSQALDRIDALEASNV